MQKTLADFMSNTSTLQAALGYALETSGYIESGDVTGLQYDTDDAEQLFIADELEKILYSLDAAYSGLEYLKSPVKAQGRLYKKDNGRYNIEDIELTSGSRIEVLLYDDWREQQLWKLTAVEHNGEDYYITVAPEKALAGIEARIRERS